MFGSAPIYEVLTSCARSSYNPSCKMEISRTSENRGKPFWVCKERWVLLIIKGLFSSTLPIHEGTHYWWDNSNEYLQHTCMFYGEIWKVIFKLCWIPTGSSLMFKDIVNKPCFMEKYGKLSLNYVEYPPVPLWCLKIQWRNHVLWKNMENYL